MTRKGPKGHRKKKIIKITADERYKLVSDQLTPWSRGLPDKLTGPQVLKKFPAFYETRRFITAFTRVRHLSYPEPDRSSPCPHSTSLRSILILFSHLRLGLPSSLLPSIFPTKTLHAPILFPYVLHNLPISVNCCILFHCLGHTEGLVRFVFGP